MHEQLTLVGNNDKIFAVNEYDPRPFAFNKEVAGVFDDMVRRSIPLYADVTATAARWTLAYFQPGSTIYDIGCSTGTFFDLIGRQLPPGVRMVGIDTSAAMLDQAQDKLAPFSARHEIRLVCGDACEQSYHDASIVIANYTLQFIPIARRRQLLTRIYHELRPGGLLMLSEKTYAECPEFQETITGFYEGFKRDNGYSEIEIARKKEALENVLVPMTEKQLLEMLEGAGFDAYQSILKWHNFVTLVAMKRS
jgi:tRNA (cmo5U34)-methyltransferase